MKLKIKWPEYRIATIIHRSDGSWDHDAREIDNIQWFVDYLFQQGASSLTMVVTRKGQST